MDVAAGLIVVVLLLAALGSCFPQLSPPVAADPERLAGWEAAVRARYGRVADSLAMGGIFRWFRSPVFLVSTALLATATLVCTLERWRTVWRRAFHRPVRCSDAAFDSAPHIARLCASLEVDLPAAVQGRLEGRGFSVRSKIVGDVYYLRGDRNRLAPLATLVTHLAVLLLLLGAALSSGYGWREDVTVEPGGTADVGHGSGLTVRNEGFTIARYPDGGPAGYEARVTVIARGREPIRGSVRVNEPLAYGSVGLHLRGYREMGDHYSVTLLAVHDPGYSLVIMAGFLLFLGMTVSFNFPHCCVHARVGPGGTLWLAGQADRRACDFDREFASMVEEIRQAVLRQEKDQGGSVC